MEKIFPENELAYEAAYKAMYPKESKDHCWKEIEGEWLRVRELNRRKPACAKDIQTYGSRIGYAVLKAVNETVGALDKRKEGRAMPE